MKKLFTILVITSLALMSCEKECPECPFAEEELCWECIIKHQERYYYCSGYTGPGQSGWEIINHETVCGLTQKQIDAKEEANTYYRNVVYNCEATSLYSMVRHNYEMECILLSE